MVCLQFYISPDYFSMIAFRSKHRIDIIIFNALHLADFVTGNANTQNDGIAEIKWSLSANTPTITTTEEHLPETTPFISLKTGKKKIPKSIEQPPSISISQSNSVTENVTSVSTDKRVVGPYIFVFMEFSTSFLFLCTFIFKSI